MTPDEKAAYARQFPVHVNVDTAKRFHVLVAMGPDRRRSKPFTVLLSRAGFQAAHAHLQALFPGLAPEQMLVGLEFAGTSWYVAIANPVATPATAPIHQGHNPKGSVNVSAFSWRALHF